MKKRAKKLALKKETIRKLEDKTVEKIAAAGTAACKPATYCCMTVGVFCTGLSCKNGA